MLTLYHSPGSSCCVKVRFQLNEKGLDWTEQLIDLRRGDQLRPEFRALNPKAEVPVIVHDDVAVPESTVIMEYLEDVFPESALRPADAAGRARMRLWTKWPDEGGHIAYSSLAFAVSHRFQAHDTSPGWVEAQLGEKPDETRQKRQKDAIDLGFDDPALRHTMKSFDAVVRRMDVSLRDHPWLAGETFTLADIALIPYIARLDVMTLLGLWRDACPRVADWLARVKLRPAYAKTYEILDKSVSHRLMRENGEKARAKLRALIEPAAAEQRYA